jgi:hypothetical protein
VASPSRNPTSSSYKVSSQDSRRPIGSSSPITYSRALAQPAELEANTLYVVGGLYGNPAALRALLERADQEPGGAPAIVFSGDFHWLDIDPEDFQAISETVLAHHAIKGKPRPSCLE